MNITCRDVEARLTPFVDGELEHQDAGAVAQHLDACPSCRRLAAAERAGRQCLVGRARRLTPSAPASLRASVRRAIPAPRRGFRIGWVLASAAVTVMATVGLIAVAELVRPIPVFAAQATLDHLKCERLGPSASSSDAKSIEASWRTWQGWNLHVPTGQQGAGIRLVGYRRCVVTEGRMAHLIYDRDGSMVSLFVLPDGPKVGHAELEIFGQDAVLWTRHGLTYALVGRGDRAALAAVAASLEHELEAQATSAGSGF